MVTPSLVMVGAPHFLSRTTLRPFGPRVTDTVSASLFTPASSARRASSSNFNTFAAIRPPRGCCGPGTSPGPRRFRWGEPRLLLLHDSEDVPGGQDEVLVTLHLDLGAPVLGVDDLVPDLHVEGDPLAVLEPARAHRDDLALLRLLLRGVRDH